MKVESWASNKLCVKGPSSVLYGCVKPDSVHLKRLVSKM